MINVSPIGRNATYVLNFGSDLVRSDNTDDIVAYKSVSNTRNLIWCSEHFLYLNLHILTYNVRKTDTGVISSKR